MGLNDRDILFRTLARRANCSGGGMMDGPKKVNIGNKDDKPRHESTRFLSCVRRRAKF
jgi:hypothetical protein